jgi:signal transduction histidine kinase
MSSSLRKVSLLILVIIILPVLIFSVFEIGNLRQNEKVIQNIYKNQLDAILFSINQYSDDIISNLASRIENSSNNYNSYTGQLEKIINEIPCVKNLVRFSNDLNFISSLPFPEPDSITLHGITSMLEKNSPAVKQLSAYMNEGYRKIETIGNNSRNMQYIIFLTRENNQQIINIMVLDPEEFVKEVLDPKIQEIAKGKFNIAAYQAGNDSVFYTSDKKYNPGKIDDKEPFWLLKNYVMGIELKDITIADLARDRIRRNLALLGLMDIILLFGAWLIFRNVSKQIELSQLKNDFVSGVSHEIRTPLALITMYIETLEMGRITSSAKIREYYTIILNETTRLSGIVNRILSFSQIESNKRKYFFSENDINEIIESAQGSLRHSAESKGFNYSFIPEKSLPVIMADREAVTDAFVNLVDNAMKYSTEIKNVIVRTGKHDKFVFIEVEDKGIGISEKNQKYIFDKFYRVTEMNLANKVKGSGLGLAIVKHIMDAHEGKIQVKSNPGEGSRFRLSFPIK